MGTFLLFRFPPFESHHTKMLSGIITVYKWAVQERVKKKSPRGPGTHRRRVGSCLSMSVGIGINVRKRNDRKGKVARERKKLEADVRFQGLKEAKLKHPPPPINKNQKQLKCMAVGKWIVTMLQNSVTTVAKHFTALTTLLGYASNMAQ